MNFTKKYSRRGRKTRSKKTAIRPLNGYIYEKNVFSGPYFKRISQICSLIKKSEMVLDSKASGRLMYTFKNTDPIHKLIYNKSFIEKVRRITRNPNLVPCLEIPIEYRIYEKGSYMDWHKDTIMLPDQYQYECVITISNTSDSRSLFVIDARTRAVSSEPNSIIIVQANGVMHKVEKTTTGERSILKLVFKENK
jgi:hypothetical protein